MDLDANTPLDILPPTGNFEELKTDPQVINIPDGADNKSNLYGQALPESDPEDDDKPPPLPPKEGIPWNDCKPPAPVMALEALDVLKPLIFVAHVARKWKHTVPTKINGWERKHLEEISSFLNLYMEKTSNTYDNWMDSSVQAVIMHQGKGDCWGASWNIRERAHKYVLMQEVPVNPFGTWAKSKLETHPELAEELKEHLVSIGKYVQAHNIITFLSHSDIKSKHNLEDTIHITMACHWMHALKFCWVKDRKGQYVDGHEPANVVHYRQECHKSPGFYFFA
ncbi:hypothetical protein DFH08DRAFT_966128 [Mycena albidolilacea]|uniref:Uncharacterized protein n=1 Tax=Mycena albidolilacea TaxID=1033008 RepID=A0AAD7EK06_9AGAR|nr:hypothetical protein DFH08DRAFT_966128 [Mycena albidolilacea]